MIVKVSPQNNFAFYQFDFYWHFFVFYYSALGFCLYWFEGKKNSDFSYNRRIFFLQNQFQQKIWITHREHIWLLRRVLLTLWY